ncbi:fimbrial protein [Buttiauxella sp. WJP83]|uniref:fimbrial protein n=1 Tax=Buttiauxella sp. WJP83 TaxID=2986951 RepID=UPI0022DDE845|nr:fimbrial protein [Buttiauxella sp. WJP83]WBM72470.1 fimbrial protein [Buttiauxella sp. WJP83]
MGRVNILARIAVICGLLLSFCFISLPASAANFGCISSPDIPGVANLSSVAVDSTLPVGSTIPGSERTFSFSGNCAAISAVPQGSAIITCYYGLGTEISGMPGVYNTGVTGVGITIINSSGQRVIGAGAGCDTRNTPLGYISNTSAKTFSVSMTLALVKTSMTIGSGSLSRAQSIFGIGMYNTGYGLGSNADSSVSYSGNVFYRAVSCSVDAIIPVPLNDVLVSNFSGTGTTAGDKNFNVPVLCNAPVNVSMNMTSAGYISKPNAVLALTPGGNNATGIGIQLLFNGNPVTFDNYFPVGNIINAGDTLNVPFVARYYQSGSSITPGTANATATVTMAYQ